MRMQWCPMAGFFLMLLLFLSLAQAESPLSLPESQKETSRTETPQTIHQNFQLDEETKELIAASPSQEQLPEDAVVYLLFEEKDRVNKDGTGEKHYHRLVKILNESGKNMAHLNLPYNVTYEEIQVEVARTIKADGRILNVDPALIQDVTPLSQLIVFDDVKIKQLVFPDVSPGDYLELKYTMIVKKPVVIGSWNTYFAHPLDMTLQCRLSIDLPVSMKAKYKVRIQEPSEPIVIQKGDRAIYSWNVKPVVFGGLYEPALPPPMEMDSFIFFSTMESWDDLTKWYVPLFESNLKTIAPQIKEKALLLTKNSSGNRIEMIKDIFNFVSQKVRYIQISLGQTAWKPYPPEYVLLNRYADCKGKTALLVAMLRSLEIDAYGVLIRPLMDGPLLRDTPSVVGFTHIIVAVPKPEGDYLYMDPTIPIGPYDFLDPLEEGQDVIILDKPVAHFEKTPILPLEKSNYTYLKEEAYVNSEGIIEIKSIRSGEGIAGINGRMMVKNINPSILKDFLVEKMRTQYPGSNLVGYQFHNLENPDQPFEMEITYEIPGLVQFIGDMMFVESGGSNIAERLLPLVTFDQRTYPLFLGIKEKMVTETTFTVPESYILKKTSEDVSISKAFGKYERRIVMKEGKVHLETLFEITQPIISREAYPELKAFIEKVFMAEKEKLVFQKS